MKKETDLFEIETKLEEIHGAIQNSEKLNDVIVLLTEIKFVLGHIAEFTGVSQNQLREINELLQKQTNNQDY